MSAAPATPQPSWVGPYITPDGRTEQLLACPGCGQPTYAGTRCPDCPGRPVVVLDGILGLVLDRTAATLTEHDDDGASMRVLDCCGHVREQHHADDGDGRPGCEFCACEVQP